MSFDVGRIQERTLNIYVYKKGTPEEFLVISQQDEILTKKGENFQTMDPTSDLFVSQMYGMKYNKIAFLEPPSVGRDLKDGMNKITQSSSDMNVGRT